MSTPQILYQTSTRLDCKPQGQPRLKFPLPPRNPYQLASYALDQDYAQRIDQFPPCPKNTPASSLGLSDANAILTAFSQPQDAGAALGRFVGTFSRVPQSWSDIRMIPFTFPGFPGIAGGGGRNIFTDTVPARIQNDYFVLDPANIISSCTAGHPATATIVDSGNGSVTCVYQLGDIPVNRRTFFVVANGGTPDFTNRTQSITPVGGITVGSTVWFQSLPSLANYKTWIANAVANTWSSTVWNGTTDAGSTIGQIIAEDSQITEYAGNIVCRSTIYVLAK